MSKNNTQYSRVINYMKEHGSITRLQAMNHIGVANLTAVISDLRAKGHNILTEEVKALNRYNEKITYAKYIYLGIKKKEN